MTNNLAAKFKEATRTEMLGIISAALVEPDGVAEFNFQAFADGRLAALPYDRFEQVMSWLGKFPPADAISPLTNADNHIEQLQFIHTILVKAPEGDTLRVFRRASNAQIAQPDGLIARLTGEGYDFVDASTSLIFDMKIDFFLWDDFIFVSSYKKLETILGFREITRSIAATVYAQILATLPVSEADELRKVIFDGARNLNKLAGMQGKPHIPMLDITRAKIIIQKRNLDVQVSVVNGVETLMIDITNIEHIRAYLHILGDDYVESQMTAIAYIATEKET